MSKIKRIVITVSSKKNGVESLDLKIDSEDLKVRGVEVLKILNQASSMVLDEIV